MEKYVIRKVKIIHSSNPEYLIVVCLFKKCIYLFLCILGVYFRVKCRHLDRILSCLNGNHTVTVFKNVLMLAAEKAYIPSGLLAKISNTFCVSHAH